MTYELNPVKVAQLLTKNVKQLDDDTLSSLASARHNALKRQLSRAPALRLTSASGHSSGHLTGRLIPHSATPWLAAGLLVVILIVGTSYWQHVKEQQIDDTDVAILISDLPIDAFVN